MAHLLRRADVPFVFSVHCQFSRQPLLAHGRAVVKQAMTGAVAGCAVSQPVKDGFLQLYSGRLAPELTVDIIWNGIDLERFRPDPTARAEMRWRLGVDDDDFVVTFCGRLDSLKQPLLALRVFASVQARCASARLLIGGGGEQMSVVKQETESLSLAGQVILTNQVSDTCAYCAASDAYFFEQQERRVFAFSPRGAPFHAGALLESHDKAAVDSVLYAGLPPHWARC